MSFNKLVLPVVVSLGVAGAAHSATVESLYGVHAAESDHANREVSLWISGGVGDLRGTFAFQDEGLFRVFEDDAASIAGRVYADDDAASGFDLRFLYDQTFDWAPEFKSQHGSVEHGNESYYDLEFGRLTGFGGLEGLSLTVRRMPTSGPYATQVGGGVLDELGANNHNQNYGLANWFFIDEVLSTDCPLCSDVESLLALAGTSGDLNVDLREVAAVPVPAAGLLLLTALGGFAAMRRKS